MSSKIKTNEKFTYNSDSKKYVFHTSSKFGTNYVFSADKVNKIIGLYSDLSGASLTMGEIARKFDIPKDIIKFVLNALGKTHASVPFTDETIIEQDEEVLVTDMHKSKAFNILQKFEKEDWKLTQEDAERWRNFKFNNVDPIEDFIKNWTPPKFVSVKTTEKTQMFSQKELLIGASDWHYGLIANARYLYNQKEWNIEQTIETVRNYAKQLSAHILKNGYAKIKLLFLGDLLHTLSGYTDKGTKLEANPIGEEQLEQAFNSVLEFINILLTSHNNIEVYSCPGNHSSLGDYTLSRMLQIYFRSDKRLKFEVTNKRNITFRCYDSLFLMEHGYAAVAKNRLPSGTKARENYINNLFMAKPEQFTGATRFYYLSADQHHSESYELTNVEGYMFPTIVGGCRHSDNSAYKARQSQTCLVVTPKGVEQVLRFYFD